ncbi:Anti-sigma regulatory factor (Ser/Thr protein kinase) [Persephonella hydrogeniphila]|uniref:Anti-sigma regulatory factor (Ser/Thr protein kinase) n=1 Tax=Persephonella hydrogeniphila TaxID=198703 RepID=A0A285NKT7_9AQUI|nr:GNAT family N-acetyltransferase [Persephonella hydrogeniphila]SNZ09567.1 Anti-sigma regulatory factor (Ser/Thr protein kinase) [Persephonella hydrogeniphila]
MEISLKLENDIRVIQPAVDFVYRWAVDCGLSEKEAQEFATAFDELITDIVLFAFEDKGEFFVLLSDSLSQLEITVHELGEPFDPERHRYSIQKVLNENNFDGAGFEVIGNLVDDFIYLYKGRAGKEFRIIKEIKHKHITQILTEKQLSTEPEKAVGYQISPVTEEDAEDIARLIYRSYGYTYPKEDMYYPDRIVNALRQGKKFGVIVRTDRGEAVGYFAVIMSTDSNIGEVGEVVVFPRHRGKGIMKMMMKALIDMAKNKGLLGLFGEAVTVHTISQKVNAKYGFKSTALVLGFFPYAKYKGFEHKQQRISVVIDFLPLKERKQLKIYLPEEYKNILKDIYRNLGIDVENIPVRKSPQLKERSKIELQINYRFGNAVIVVKKYGKDMLDRVAKKLEALYKKDIKGIYIDLPLDHPYVKQAVPQLKKMGFIFSGLMPLFHNERDFLRMQILREKLDFRHINVFSDMAKRIKRFIHREMNKNGIPQKG